jgi:predicted dienelactone hydrolase
VPDGRVKALLLLAPAAAWFMAPGALAGVRVPVLMLTAGNDPHTPAWHGELVKRGVADPALVEHRTVPNAGHFSFLTPFPAAMTNPGFAPSQDPPGFDRVGFHAEMNAEIAAFLDRTLRR